jgi:hypothetical protein
MKPTIRKFLSENPIKKTPYQKNPVRKITPKSFKKSSNLVMEKPH